ncbi:uncharacterized protein EV422DRAFT_575499 [Fimicolochytrium jonesii]|uniref:uncharacterized protein n=1 Tax=Fimicolochytrium jonesii TaxID=1396493 RepID=UPI0022FE2480|nr:uncharacterized protein EV422DRAFT_575499 [Fimicolochytrium jonesii]KAI8827268.1 hypothetical protein EV422DRAFT_575499 [Fimicolochytrium jonesii]
MQQNIESALTALAKQQAEASTSFSLFSASTNVSSQTQDIINRVSSSITIQTLQQAILAQMTDQHVNMSFTGSTAKNLRISATVNGILKAIQNSSSTATLVNQLATQMTADSAQTAKPVCSSACCGLAYYGQQSGGGGAGGGGMPDPAMMAGLMGGGGAAGGAGGAAGLQAALSNPATLSALVKMAPMHIVPSPNAHPLQKEPKKEPGDQTVHQEGWRNRQSPTSGTVLADSNFSEVGQAPFEHEQDERKRPQKPGGLGYSLLRRHREKGSQREILAGQAEKQWDEFRRQDRLRQEPRWLQGSPVRGPKPTSSGFLRALIQICQGQTYADVMAFLERELPAHRSFGAVEKPDVIIYQLAREIPSRHLTPFPAAWGPVEPVINVYIHLILELMRASKASTLRRAMVYFWRDIGTAMAMLGRNWRPHIMGHQVYTLRNVSAELSKLCAAYYALEKVLGA